MKPRWIARVLLLPLAACGNLHAHLGGDGGASGDGGSQSDGSVSDGDSGPSSDSGVPADGGNLGDAGAGTDGGNGDGGHPLTWSLLVEPSPPVTGGFASVGGYIDSSLGLTLFAPVNNRLYRFNAGTWTFPYTDTSNFSGNAVWVSPSGAVYLGGEGFLAYCPGNCTAQSAFTRTSSAISFYGVCALDANHVYAAGYDSVNSNQGALYKYDTVQSAWVSVSTNTGTQDNSGCWVDPSGIVYAGAFTGVSLYQPSSSSFAAEGFGTLPSGFPAQGTNNKLLAVWGNGTDVFAAGEYRLIVHRNASGTWDSVLWDPGTASVGGNLAAMVGVGAQALALGDTGGAWNMADFSVAGGWASDTNGPGGNIYGAWVDPAGRIYAAGTDSSGNAAIWLGQP